MNLSLSLSLGGNSLTLDPDARAYIAAVVAAGGTVSGTQKNAINTFYKTGKSDGWYSSLKRLYLPIWAAAAPNAIDMIGRTSGTFVGTVTHAAGYVQGDGSTGYFDFGSTFAAIGATSNSISVIAGRLQSGAGSSLKAMIGTRGTTSNTTVLEVVNDGNAAALVRVVGFGVTSRPNVAGLNKEIGFFRGSIDTTDRRLIRVHGGEVESLSDARPAGGTVEATFNVNAMRRNWATPDLYDNGRLMAYGAGLASSDADGQAMLENLKTLWETCTGLTLP